MRMKRRPNTIAICITLSFSLGVLCATMAAPARALASVSGCSGAMVMVGCELPSYLCGFDNTSNLVSWGAIGPRHSTDLLKDALVLALGVAIDVAGDLAPPGASMHRRVDSADPRKVSVRLYNSVLNL